MQLSEVIAPVTTQEFIDRYLGREMLLTPGAARRFAHLLPWTELNSALNRLRVSGPRLRLVQHGQSVPRDAYLEMPNCELGSPIKGAALERLLRGGATLVMDAVEDLFPPVRALAESFEELFRGTVGSAEVHPREVVRQALLHNAAAVIFAHNHPSGSPQPSPADEYVTRKLKESLALMDIRVLDHIIVGEGYTYSFAAVGRL